MTNLSPRCLPPEVFASINASSMIGSEKTVSSRPVPFGYSVRVNALTCVGVVGSVVRLIKCLVYELSASVQCEQKLLGLEDFSGSSIGVDEVVYLKRNYIEISVTRLTLGMGNSNLFLTRMDVLRSWVEDEIGQIVVFIGKTHYRQYRIVLVPMVQHISEVVVGRFVEFPRNSFEICSKNKGVDNVQLVQYAVSIEVGYAANNNQQQQQQNKRQNTGRAYAAGSGKKKPYGGSKPLCSKCNYHHDGQCAPKCHKCNRVGHMARDCRSTANANTANNQRGTGAGGNGNALAKVYAVGRARTNPDSNVVTGTFLLNNRYASILFYTGADRSFVSTAFSSQIDITPSTLDHYYDVELADGRIIGLNAIIQGCTLNFLNHPLNIDLMPVELGSVNVIIGMDWLAKYQAVIVCVEKIVRIPWGNETLIVRGDGSDQGNETHLNIISCNKTQKYLLKGCPVFLANVTTKENEDKSEKKRLEDVPIVQNFPKVFPKDLLGLPPTRQVEFQIDLIFGASLVAQAPYQLAPSKMKELSDQL
ncbi:putative reverse transcriptase domain-containing protein [Tanacetum coccineum]